MNLTVTRSWRPGFTTDHEEIKILNFWAAADEYGTWSVVREDNGDTIAHGRTRVGDIDTAKARCEAVIRHRHELMEKTA